MEETLQIRASDFKRMWPDALAAAISEAWELTQSQAQLHSKIDSSLLEVAQLGPLVTEAIANSAEIHMKNVKDLGQFIVEAIKVSVDIQKASNNELSKNLKSEQEAFLAMFKSERENIFELRKAMDIQRADIERAQVRLDAARANFNNMSLMQRIFKRV
jgi:hypothetical protein